MLLNSHTNQIFVDGEWQPSAGGTMPVEDPSTGEMFGEIASASRDDVDAAVSAARKAADGDWGSSTALERSRTLARISALIEEHADELATIESRDVGKPLTQAHADVTAIARYFEFYAGAADKLHGETIPYLRDYSVYTLREPHGVTAHIIPWNYPLQIIGRSVGAALTMGNAVVLKSAEDASLSSIAFTELCHVAGLPDGAINLVPGLGGTAGAALAQHPGVDHVSFTGSVRVGQLVQAAAAKNVAPVTLELGGKSPQLVFEDADVDAAMPFLLRAALQNAGQTCSAASRVLVHASRYEEVLERLATAYSDLRAGPALDDFDLGPLISKQQKARVQSMIDDAGKRGNVVTAEGQIDDGAPQGGHYVKPVLFSGVSPEDPLAQDEVFGPVQVVMPFDSEEEAVAMANGTGFGLVASVWTRDGARQMRLSRKLRAGQVFVNNYGAGGGVELPFGGVGKSGHGREKGFEALYGFSVLKTVAAYYGD